MADVEVVCSSIDANKGWDIRLFIIGGVVGV